MSKFKKAILIGITVLALSSLSVTAFAASRYGSPAEAVAAMTGKTVEAVRQERAETGKRYGEMAREAGKSEEFRAEKLEIMKDRLAKKVADGKITQERADEILAAIEERMANCDGTGSQSHERLGLGNGECGGNGGEKTRGGQGPRDGSGNRGNGGGDCTGECQNP